MTEQAFRTIDAGLSDGLVIPYLGPGVLTLVGEDCPLPSSSAALIAQLGENYNRRNTVTRAIGEAFSRHVPPSALHNYLATLPELPLIVHDWYDDLTQQAFAVRSSWSVWGMVQGISGAEHFGQRVQYLCADGKSAQAIAPDVAETWATLLYQPLGSVAPASSLPNSDADFTELMSEVDDCVSIPERVQTLRAGRHFLFLGCRFISEFDQIFVRRIMNCSSGTHWAVLPEEPTRNEMQFLAEQNIERIDVPLADFVVTLAETRREEKVQVLQACW